MHTSIASVFMKQKYRPTLLCDSPHATVGIIKELKTTRAEPNPEVVSKYGVLDADIDAAGVEEDNAGEVDRGAGKVVDERNLFLQDLLLTMPGVLNGNVRQLMSKIDTIAELSIMTEEELGEILGPRNGKMLYEFVNEKN